MKKSKKAFIDVVSTWEKDETLAREMEKACAKRKRAKLKKVKL